MSAYCFGCAKDVDYTPFTVKSFLYAPALVIHHCPVLKTALFTNHSGVISVGLPDDVRIRLLSKGGQRVNGNVLPMPQRLRPVEG